MNYYAEWMAARKRAELYDRQNQKDVVQLKIDAMFKSGMKHYEVMKAMRNES